MADPTPAPAPKRLSLSDRQLVADTLQSQNDIARAEIYRRLQPEDEAWLRAALNDPDKPMAADAIRSRVTTDLTDAARYARDNPVKVGAITAATVVPALMTGGASAIPQIAAAGLAGAGGAGLGAITGAAYGAPDVTPSMSTPSGTAQRLGTEGLGQLLAAATGHGIGAGMRGSANILQRAGLPDQLAKEFPTLAETLNKYWINPTTAGGLAQSKILRKQATGALRDVVDAGIARGERGIVESDLAPYMRSSLKQAREEGFIAPTEGRAIIKKQIADLMGQQPMGTFPLPPQPYPFQGASSNVIPGSPSTQPWWRGWASRTIPGSPPGPGGGLGAPGGGAAGGGGGGGIAPWMRGIFRRPPPAGAEALALPEAQAAQGAFQPTSPAIAPHAGEVVEPGAMGGITPGSPTFQPTSPTAASHVTSGPVPPPQGQLQPTGLAIAPRAGEIVTPGELEAGATIGALPGSGEVPAIRPRTVNPSSDPLLQPTGIVPSDRTLITPRTVNEGLPPGATGEFQPTGLAEAGPQMSVSETPPRIALQPTSPVLQGERQAFQPTGIARRVVEGEVVPEDLARRVVEGEVVPDPTLLQPTGLATQGRVTAGPIPTPATVSNLPPGAVPNFGGGLGGLPPNAGALPPAGGGSAPRWTPQTTFQEPEIPLRRMAAIRRQLFGRSKDVIKANALEQRPDRVSGMAYSDLANAVGQEADQRMPGWLAANAETQKFVGTTRAAKAMQDAKITPGRVAAALGAATALGGGTAYETHNPLEAAAAFTLPFALMSPANTARTAIALYQAGRLPLAQLLQVATPELLERFGITEGPAPTTQESHDPYAFLDEAK